MLELIFFLIVGHFVADYALQSEYMALGKNRHKPLDGVPFYHPLAAHCVIHGGAVAFITGSVWLGFLEIICHWIIDDNRCAKKITYTQDQALHILCKLVWAVLTVTVGAAM